MPLVFDKAKCTQWVAIKKVNMAAGKKVAAKNLAAGKKVAASKKVKVPLPRKVRRSVRPIVPQI